MTDVCLGLDRATSTAKQCSSLGQGGCAESLKQSLPYELHGVDTDNGFEFINKTMIGEKVHTIYKQCKTP